MGFLLGAFLFSAVTVIASERSVVPNPFRILVDGQERQVEAYLIDGRTFLQLRGIAELINGVEVDFIDSTIIINTGGNADLTINNNENLVVGNIEYISVFDLPEYRRVGDIIYRVRLSDGVFSLVETDSDGIVTKVIVENIPFTIRDGLTFIPRNFYERELRPFLED